MGLLSSLGKVFGSVSGADWLSTGASLLNGLMNRNSQKEANEQNLKIAQMNNDTQIQMMRENNEFNRQQAIDMFNMQNEYNDPAAQVQRLRNAGINPNAAFEGSGAVVSSGNGNAMTPSSVGTPSFTSPIMQPVPSVSAGLLESLMTLSQIGLNRSNSAKSSAEANRTNKLVDIEAANLMADKNYKEAQTSYLQFTEQMERLFQENERNARLSHVIQEVANLGVQFTNLMFEGDYIQAKTMFEKANTALTNSRNTQVKLEMPLILENLKRTGQLILAQKNAADASADAARSTASLNRENAQTVKELRSSVVSMARAAALEKQAHAQVASSTVFEQIEHWRNTIDMDDKQKQLLDEHIRKAKKDNDWYEVDKCVDILDTIADDVLGYMTFGISGSGNHQSSSGSSTYDVNSYLYE